MVFNPRLIIVSDSFIMISELEMFFIIPVWAKEDEKNIQIKHFWLAFILWFENELSKNNSNRIRFIPTNFDKTESQMKQTFCSRLRKKWNWAQSGDGGDVWSSISILKRSSGKPAPPIFDLPVNYSAGFSFFAISRTSLIAC